MDKEELQERHEKMDLYNDIMQDLGVTLDDKIPIGDITILPKGMLEDVLEFYDTAIDESLRYFNRNTTIPEEPLYSKLVISCGTPLTEFIDVCLKLRELLRNKIELTKWKMAQEMLEDELKSLRKEQKCF